MRDKLAGLNEQGRRDCYTGANSGLASKLACLLGVPGLARLNEWEANELLNFINSLALQADEEGFSDGWHARASYNPNATSH